MMFVSRISLKIVNVLHVLNNVENMGDRMKSITSSLFRAKTFKTRLSTGEGEELCFQFVWGGNLRVFSIAKSGFGSLSLDLRISNRTQNSKTDFTADFVH